VLAQTLGGLTVNDAHHDLAMSDSAHERQRRTGYRTTVTPAVGDTATVSVYADRPWTDTGLYLDAGEYMFSATPVVGLARLVGVESGMLDLSGGLFSRIVDRIFAYPNEALGFYGNNSGSVRLTVTRTG
jgi:hypothetical protein